MQNTRQLKVHFVNGDKFDKRAYGRALCSSRGNLLTNCLSRITCKRCLQKLSYKYFKRKLKEKLHKMGHVYEIVSPGHTTVLCSCPPKQIIKPEACSTCGLPIAQDLVAASKLRNKGGL